MRLRLYDLTIVGLAVGALAVAAVVEVHGDVLAAWGFALPNLCRWRALIGMPCPTCGLTRGFVATAQGDWARGFGLHPLAPGVYVFALAQALLALRRLWQQSRGRRAEATTAATAPIQQGGTHAAQRL